MTNRKILAVLCLITSLFALFSCRGKNQDLKPSRVPINTESVWENIEDHKIISTIALDIAAKDDYKKLVGVCYDGELYAYFAFESDDQKSVICKYDMKKNSLKRTSSELAISDINGICCKKNTVVVLHGGKNVTSLDNSSFEKVKSYSMFFDATGISYSKKYDRYYITLANGGISVMNSDLEHISDISPIDALLKVTSVTCSSKYIFTMVALENGSEIVVYDFNGDYVSTASVFDVGMIPTSFYCDGDVFYVAYQTQSGASLYKTEITKK